MYLRNDKKKGKKDTFLLVATYIGLFILVSVVIGILTGVSLLIVYMLKVLF